MAGQGKADSRLLQYLRNAPEDSIFGLLGIADQQRKKQATADLKRAEAEERKRRQEEAAAARAAAVAEAERKRAEQLRIAAQRFVHGALSKKLQLWVEWSAVRKHLRFTAAKVTALQARRLRTQAWEGWCADYLEGKERAAAEAAAAVAAAAAAEAARCASDRWMQHLNDELEKILKKRKEGKEVCIARKLQELEDALFSEHGRAPIFGGNKSLRQTALEYAPPRQTPVAPAGGSGEWRKGGREGGAGGMWV
jgi:hypothetical protein